MSTVMFDKNLVRSLKKHSSRFVALAFLLLLTATLTLAASTMWTSGPAFFFGQVFFVVLVFASISLLVVAAVSRDLKSR